MDREDRLKNLHPLFRTIDNAIKLYVDLLGADPNQTDAELKDALTLKGVEDNLASSVVVFMPLACGRVILDGLKVEYARTYVNGDTKEEHLLSEDPVFLMSLEWIGLLLNNENKVETFKKIALRSSEVSAANNALHGGMPQSELSKAKLRPTTISF